LFTKASKSGDADVRDFAAQTLPALRDHLQMAKDLTAAGHGRTDHSRATMPPPVDKPAGSASTPTPPTASDRMP